MAILPLLLCVPLAAVQAENPPPNLVVILADDLGWADLSCQGAAKWSTPNVDRLAAEGARLTGFYSAAPVCTPTRAGLLTGCNPKRIGLANHVLFPFSEHGLADGETTIAELLQERGYATACIGKWHLGHQAPFHPLRHGFDRFFGVPYSNDMDGHHYRSRSWTAPPLPLYDDSRVIEESPDQSLLTRRYTEQAVAFVREHADEPFFLYMPHTMPHKPIAASEAFRGSSEQGLYGDVVQELDWSVGAVLAALEEAGVADNTWVVFTSDNGPWRQASTGELRGKKGTTWEGGMRVPTAMRWPGTIAPGTEISALSSVLDLLPTMAEAVGAELPTHPIDGRSLLPLLRDASAGSPHASFPYYHNDGLEAVRDARFKLVVHRPEWRGRERAPQLFDLDADPGETTDVAAEHPGVVARLQALAEGWRGELGDAATGRAGEGVRRAGRLVPPLLLSEARHAPTGERILVGQKEVFEDRERGVGRTLLLDVVVLPARNPKSRPDPIVFLAGGPGQAATRFVDHWVDSPLRADRDVVLVDQRGTGGAHRLDVALASSIGDLQELLDPPYAREALAAALPALAERADLSKYSTPLAMDDLDEVRAALGYNRINLVGASYGTRAALVYMRRHPARVRTAILSGAAPLAMKSPLHHAREAQAALDALLAECAADPDCAAAFPDLPAMLAEVFTRLEAAPAEITFTHPDTGEEVPLSLSRDVFAEALRLLLYDPRLNRGVPLFISEAHAGDFSAFTDIALAWNRFLLDQVALGMMLCVTCAEDLLRLEEGEIERETAGTFLGDGRVRAQLAVCELWPRSDLPEEFGDPVTAAVPTLILSGNLDPATGPRMGEEAARHLPRSLHVVYPGAHFPLDAACLDEIRRAFLDTGTVEGLDLSCVEQMEPGAFVLSR